MSYCTRRAPKALVVRATLLIAGLGMILPSLPRGAVTNAASVAPSARQDGAAVVASFDVCLTDDRTGFNIQYSSQTGAYTFSACSAGISISGTGKATNRDGVVTLTDKKADRTLSAAANAGLTTGSATVTIKTGQGSWRTFHIVDTRTGGKCAACVS
ncbi:MAG TPA: hypothetical protein VJX67_20510 [Blastocatellia bacterium]|nr:hypothetical protein [Blastocatellia bacterium]